MIRGDATQVYRAATELSTVGFKMIPALRSAMAQAGQEFAAEWADNAREHFHAKGHAYGYPDSIDSELAFSITNVAVDVGPNTAKKHGFLGGVLEFGNEDTPPYLDGLRALDVIGPAVESLVAAVVGGTFVANTPAANTLQEYTTLAGVTRLATAAQIANWTRGRS